MHFSAEQRVLHIFQKSDTFNLPTYHRFICLFVPFLAETNLLKRSDLFSVFRASMPGKSRMSLHSVENSKEIKKGVRQYDMELLVFHECHQILIQSCSFFIKTNPKNISHNI